MRKQGDKVRISVELVQASDGFRLWSESYDGDLSDVFELQERIARAVVDELKVVLQGNTPARLVPKATNNIEAHQQYLRGRYFWNRRGFDNLQNAVTAFKAALAADPDYVDAWAGLAQTYALIPEYSASDPAGNGKTIDTVSEALDAADHALRLDPVSSRALSARAYVRCVYQFDWAESRGRLSGRACQRPAGLGRPPLVRRVAYVSTKMARSRRPVRRGDRARPARFNHPSLQGLVRMVSGRSCRRPALSR